MKLFRCSICGFDYADKLYADKCRKWCTKYKSCNLGITKHAVTVS